jgi:hypothetical protein
MIDEYEGWIFEQDPPKDGEYIVIDAAYQHMSLAQFRKDMGWCINGRWRGFDAALCYKDAPKRPKHPKVRLRF